MTDVVRYKVVIIHGTPEQRPDFAGDMRVIALRKVVVKPPAKVTLHVLH